MSATWVSQSRREGRPGDRDISHFSNLAMGHYKDQGEVRGHE